MVAEFRRAKPHMVYVNLNDSINSERGANTSESAEAASHPYRGIVRENIIRRGDTALLNKLLDADPQLRPVIMGSCSPNELGVAPYSQMNHFPSGENSSQGQPSVAGSFGTESSFAAGRSNLDSTHVGGGSHTSASGHSSGTVLDSQSNASSSRTNAPQIRLADFSNVSSFGVNEDRSIENSLVRNYTLAHPPAVSNSAFNSNFNVGPTPAVTIIRSTSTYEIRTSPTSSTYNLGSDPFTNHVQGTGAPSMSGHFSNTHGVGSHVNPSYVSSQVNYGIGFGANSSYGQGVAAGYSSDGDSSRHVSRRTGGSVGPVRPRHTPAEALCIDPQCKATKYLLDQKSILKENEALKRKVHILAETISDKEKLAKVLRCLADRRAAAAAADARR